MTSKSKKLLRIIFQLFALGVFTFQIQNSIKKYNQKPVVQQSSTTSLQGIMFINSWI